MSKAWFVKTRIKGKWRTLYFQDQGGNELLDASKEPGSNLQAISEGAAVLPGAAAPDEAQGVAR